MRILIADDDREICDLLEIYINNEGFEVVKAYDGKEAYQKFKKQILIACVRYYDA